MTTKVDIFEKLSNLLRDQKTWQSTMTMATELRYLNANKCLKNYTDFGSEASWQPEFYFHLAQNSRSIPSHLVSSRMLRYKYLRLVLQVT